MAHQITLSNEELQLVLSALRAVSPSGGSSEPFRVESKITVQTGVSFDDQKKVVRHIKTVVDELRESFNEKLTLKEMSEDLEDYI